MRPARAVAYLSDAPAIALPSEVVTVAVIIPILTCALCDMDDERVCTIERLPISDWTYDVALKNE